MHAGFRPLRAACPMNVRKRYAARDRGADVAANVARIEHLWRLARARFGSGGPFLFGAFGAADAMYAPVVTRFLTYDVALDPACAAYCTRVMALPAMQEWVAAARAEVEEIDELDAEF
jgi:glutathione S-transferase